MSTLRSSAALGLDIASAEASSTLASTSEINTGSTVSYGSSTLNLTGPGQSSTSTGTLSGTITGINSAANASALVLKVTKTATLNALLPVNAKFEVRDQSGTVLFSFDGNLRSGQSVYLGADIGLSVTFSSGRLSVDHTASTSVTRTPIHIDPNATFNNANTALRPQFEGGAQVIAGAFTVNGVSIAVNAGDTVNAVISRINASAAGVTATFANDRISMATNASSEDDIVLAGDTSNFLNATKLASATTSHGSVRDDLQVLSKTPQFAAVANGAFSINGVSISVNRNTDSLSSIAARINSAGAGVTAQYDATTDRFVLSGTSISEDLITVSGDTSGLLAAARLSTGNTLRGNVRDDRQVFAKTTQFAAVTSGTFSIGGVSIAIDRDTDTVSTVVSKINAATAGVTAQYDSASDKLVLTATANGEDLIAVGGDTTGFLTAAHLSTAGTVRGHYREDQVALRNLAEFQSVVDGSFEVDGRTIDVDTSTDTIQSLIDRINDAGARVLAAYDTASDRITLQALYDSEDDLPIGNDTTGFLAAAHLTADNTVEGNVRDDRQVLSKMSSFGSVTDGHFEVNGRTISVDAETDTLTTLIDRINAAGAGVTAVYDAASDRIHLESIENSEDAILVGSDTSGFLNAAGLSSANSVQGSIADDGQVLSAVESFSAVRDGAFRVNGVLIEVRVNEDTVQSIVERINASDAAVEARYDEEADKITLESGAAHGVLSLDSDTSGILSAAGLATGTTGTSLNSDGAFNATGLDAPVFETGVTVGAGSFVINGVTIAVNADDTVNAVLERITASSAGVRAAYDAETQTIILTSKEKDASSISIGSDTSGFLAAVKLDAGTEGVTGSKAVDPFDSTFSDIEEYAGVHDGTLTVNGSEVTIDSDLSLREVIAVLNRAGTVKAALSENGGRIELTGVRNGDSITISDTSGLLAALGMNEGIHRARRAGPASGASADNTAADQSSPDVAAAAERLRVAMERLVRDDADSQVRDVVDSLAGAAREFALTQTGEKLSLLIDRARIEETIAASPAPAAVDTGAKRKTEVAPSLWTASRSLTDSGVRSGFSSQGIGPFAFRPVPVQLRQALTYQNVEADAAPPGGRQSIMAGYQG